MNVLQSPFAHKVEATISLDIGNFYFFENYIIAEFNEGKHVTFNAFKDVIDITKEQYCTKSQIFISNRIHSYSVDLMDILSNSKDLNFLSAYVIVSYSQMTNKVIELENEYFAFPRKRFSNLIDAVTWACKEIKN